MKVDNLFDFWSLSCMKKDGFAERLHMEAAVQYNCFFFTLLYLEIWFVSNFLVFGLINSKYTQKTFLSMTPILSEGNFGS